VAFGIADGYRVSYDPVGDPIVSVQVNDRWVELGRARDLTISYNRNPDGRITYNVEDPVRGDTYEIRNPNRVPGCPCVMCEPRDYRRNTDYPRNELRELRPGEPPYVRYGYNDADRLVDDLVEYDRAPRPFARYWTDERPPPQSEADQKAQALLRRLLTDEQVVTWTRDRYIDVTGSEGTRFRVYPYNSGNVALLDETGNDGGRLCAAPRQVVQGSDGRVTGYLPGADMVAGQILMLRTDEIAFWEIANIYISRGEVERRRREIMAIRDQRREAAKAAEKAEALRRLTETVTSATAAYVSLGETVGVTQAALDPLIVWATANRGDIRFYP
jgi:hypothetical protein